MAYLPYIYPFRFEPEGYLSGPPLSSEGEGATITATITAIADVANAPAAPWSSLANAIDGNLSTSASIASLVGSSDFIDCTLGNLPPASAAAITNFSVTIKVGATEAG